MVCLLCLQNVVDFRFRYVSDIGLERIIETCTFELYEPYFIILLYTSTVLENYVLLASTFEKPGFLSRCLR